MLIMIALEGNQTVTYIHPLRTVLIFVAVIVLLFCCVKLYTFGCVFFPLQSFYSTISIIHFFLAFADVHIVSPSNLKCSLGRPKNPQKIYHKKIAGWAAN